MVSVNISWLHFIIAILCAVLAVFVVLLLLMWLLDFLIEKNKLKLEYPTKRSDRDGRIFDNVEEARRDFEGFSEDD